MAYHSTLGKNPEESRIPHRYHRFIVYFLRLSTEMRKRNLFVTTYLQEKTAREDGFETVQTGRPSPSVPTRYVP
ncbi:hypothetical protein SAMN04487950_1199 [Halogranum rubrum]|uniref:Uncharacterized protein n=1 Tax=Halogranum rubrum TaxID=553466 RepID=A0A1I4CI13_9EURY|nr:hypothetical protein SAMN04487950_1199 [Halogranum rubrum]